MKNLSSICRSVSAALGSQFTSGERGPNRRGENAQQSCAAERLSTSIAQTDVGSKRV